MNKNKICIFGAGSIGCYIGGRLQAAGARIQFIGRGKTAERLAQHGLQLSDYRSHHKHVPAVPADAISFSEDPALAADSQFIFVSVKSGDSAAVAAQLATLGLQAQTIVSFQNGVANTAIFSKALPQLEIIPGMVPFNVVQQSPGHFHQSTEGELIIGDSPSSTHVKDLFANSGIDIKISNDISGVQHTKLLMNLSNAINALSGVTLFEQLQNPRYRAVMAAIIEEALQVFKHARISSCRVGKIIPWTLPFILRLPTFAFSKVARAMLAIDPTARSSMYDDLSNRRPTEVDYLNGEIVRIAERTGTDAPLNRLLCQKVKSAEQRASGSPHLSPEALLDTSQ